MPLRKMHNYEGGKRTSELANLGAMPELQEYDLSKHAGAGNKNASNATLSCWKNYVVAFFQVQLAPKCKKQILKNAPPKKENATVFLDWFETLNCYQITYSKNKKMIQAVSKIFTNGL